MILHVLWSVGGFVFGFLPLTIVGKCSEEFIGLSVFEKIGNNQCRLKVTKRILLSLCSFIVCYAVLRLFGQVLSIIEVN